MRKAIAMFVVLTLLMNMFFVVAVATSTPAFIDVPDTHWAYSSIRSMSEKGVMMGLGNGRFKPEGTITRAEFITVVTRAMVPGKIVSAVKDTWYEANYNAAMTVGLIQGDEMPNTPQSMGLNITRYEVSRILVRADKNINGNTEVTTDTSKIKDYEDISTEYNGFVAQAYAKGLLSGYGDGTFSGNDTMNRAQAAVVVERLLKVKMEKVEQFPLLVNLDMYDTYDMYLDFKLRGLETQDEQEDFLKMLFVERPDVMPKIGEYTAEYQSYLDNCGEEIITRTISFKMEDLTNHVRIPNTEMHVWASPRLTGKTYDQMFVTTIKSDSNGEGSFTLDMPRSVYEKAELELLNKTYGPDMNPFHIYGVEAHWGYYYDKEKAKRVDATVNGVNYYAQGGGISYNFMKETPHTLELPFAIIH